MPSSSRPLHPALVHMPIAFLVSSFLSDIFTHTAQNYPTVIAPVATFTATPIRTLIQFTTLFSYLLIIAGLLTAIPAVLSGGAQAIALISERGMKAKTVQMTIIHAVTMDLSIVAAAYNWYSRKDAEGFLSENVNLAVSAAMFGLMAFSANIGGALVYEHGVGVSKVGQMKKGAAGGKKEL